jgi:adenylate cyclase class IV
MAKEIEAKFLNIDKDALRARLRAGGFQLIEPEYLMRRKTFDCSLVFPERKMWGRVRREAGRVTMTLKEIIGEGINGMQEFELTVDDFETACAFMQCAGMPIKSSQENTRELWRRADVEVALDTWPGLKPFVEIEAAAEADVRAVSAELGFDFRDALFGGVDIVYEHELGIPADEFTKLPEITFTSPPRHSAPPLPPSGGSPHAAPAA